jgi:hypothetical protein
LIDGPVPPLIATMAGVEVRFEDVDDDGDREVVVETQFVRAVLRVPERLGEAFYRHRWSWGGRLQSLVYRPTGREFFLPTMIDVEDIAPFGLPDELFASLLLAPAPDGAPRRLKPGVGVFTGQGAAAHLAPLPWTWTSERRGAETRVRFRQDVDVAPWSFVYEKTWRFRDDAAWVALDVAWHNRGSTTLVSDWDVHTFHDAGQPPQSAWMVAPKRAWVSFGDTRRRSVLKEPSAIHVAPTLEERVWERQDWDLDGDPWWYATGPGDGDEFYLHRSRFEPYWGLWFSGYGAYTPQGISHVEVPPGERAVWGFDVTLGTAPAAAGARHFVAAGEEAGLTIARLNTTGAVIANGPAVAARLALHAARAQAGELGVVVLDESGSLHARTARTGAAAPGEPLVLDVGLPAAGDLVDIEATWTVNGRPALHTRETVALRERRPTAHLPFDAAGARVFVACAPDREHAETDGRYLQVNGIEAGFHVDWEEPAATRAPERLDDWEVICVVGDGLPLDRVHAVRAWVESGGGLLLCAPFGRVVEALGDAVPVRPAGGGMRTADPVLGLRLGEGHATSERLMLDPDAQVRIAHWQPCQGRGGATVPLRFTDEDSHPALALWQVGRGRVAALASRPAWGAHYNNATWDGWGQYYRAFFGGLLGWLSGRVGVDGPQPSKASTRRGMASVSCAGRVRAKT